MNASLDNFSKWYLENKKNLLKNAYEWKESNNLLKSKFLKMWPMERLEKMTIDEYVIGKGPQNKSFCYELESGEFSNLFLGIRGGFASKFGIYWSKSKNTYCDQRGKDIPNEDLNEKFSTLRRDLVEIIKAGTTQEFSSKEFSSTNSFYYRTAIITKVLCIYTPNSLFSGINMNKEKEKKNLWEKLSNEGIGKNVYELNKKVTSSICQKHPELNGDLLSYILWEYRKEVIEIENLEDNQVKEQTASYNSFYSKQLISSKNIILRGAPGTGKTYLANEIAADIVSKGRTTQLNELSEDEKCRVGFVQFHPSYDYTDFVEGLRPTTSEDGAVSFTLKSGSFKSFVEKALKNKSFNEQDNFDEAWAKFFETVTEAGIEDEGYTDLYTLKGKPIKNLLTYDRNGMQGIYPAGTTIYLNHDQIYNVYRGLPGTPKQGLDAYRKAVIKHLKKEFGLKNYIPATEVSANNQNYVFIIDEINRGEISKIFGELFYSIDPGYRGNKNGVYTQYANLHDNPEEKFYIPNNVYIIGTMNDIDRSVDTFDFAMRRRFTFIEISTAESAEKMLKKSSTKTVMSRLNQAISGKVGGLSKDYEIGASYFVELDNQNETMDQLWSYRLSPLLKDYFRGQHQFEEKIKKLQQVYFNEAELDEESSL